MSAEEYTRQVVQGQLSDPTLTFQLKQGFEVVAVVPGYLHHDPESLGYAAVIEWMNPDVAQPVDYRGAYDTVRARRPVGTPARGAIIPRFPWKFPLLASDHRIRPRIS